MKINAKICYGSIKNSMVVVDGCPCGTCYSEAIIEIPEIFDVAKNTSEQTIIGYKNSYYLIDDILCYNDKSKKIYLLNVWEIENKPEKIVLKATIEEGTHFS